MGAGPESKGSGGYMERQGTGPNGSQGNGRGERRIGMAIVGLGGAVATTAVAGVELGAVPRRTRDDERPAAAAHARAAGRAQAGALDKSRLESLEATAHLCHCRTLGRALIRTVGLRDGLGHDPILILSMFM